MWCELKFLQQQQQQQGGPTDHQHLVLHKDFGESLDCLYWSKQKLLDLILWGPFMRVWICYFVCSLAPHSLAWENKHCITSQMPTIRLGCSRFRLIYKTGTWHLLQLYRFQGGPADSKSSIFICNHCFPSSLINLPYINSSLVFTSQYHHCGISSARSFVIIIIDGDHTAPFCWATKTKFDTNKSYLGSERGSCSLRLLFCCSDTRC